MLDKAAKILEKNGLILYMVCSFLEIETTNRLLIFKKECELFNSQIHYE